MATTVQRVLGRSGIEVSPVGFGCWAIGGPFVGGDGKPAGWGEVDDAESIAAINRALELGVTFFDTADVYGVGHSETVLGQALAGRRDRVVIATKFGNVFDASTRAITGSDISPGYVRGACEASLRRLNTDHIDLYQLHVGDVALSEVDGLLATLEELVAAGKIRAYGWSTDDPTRAAAFAKGSHCVAVQHELNVLGDTAAMLDVCTEYGLTSINRGPLAMGLLSGKYTATSTLATDDVRGDDAPGWMRYFADGRPSPHWLARLAAIREVLTGDGRTLAQGALGWILARHDATLPIPGCRTVAQTEENAGTLARGPLGQDAVTEIARLLAD
ncbi:MAG TPA: aldo/keto reductase [Pseudonocardiaceae bacterium]|jgi:aryl-alcohol dehydrogenase-like predicted oxidoreductase|nr:aldo/keto reductase [Pseudonocardiaceae bacterium]